MDMQLSITPNSSELLLWVGISLIVVSLVYLRLLVAVEKTRRTFRVLQPDVQITKIETVYVEGEDRLTFSLRNIGGSRAADISVTIHGRDGIEPCPIIPAMTPGVAEHKVWIKAGSDSPLLHEKRDDIRLMIRYRDQWGYPYTLTYPVVQRESIYGWVALQLVDRGQPRVSRPSLPFFRMRKHLRRYSPKTHKGKVHENALRGQIDIGHDELPSRSLLHSYFRGVWHMQSK